jgi:hypothetical protein
MNTQTALEEFIEHGGNEIAEPLERLRFYCSLIVKGQDWLDVEQLFNDVEELLK